MPIPIVPRLKSVFCLLALVSLLTGQEANAKNFIGYTGKSWESDYGVLRGHCDSRLIQAEISNGNIGDQMAYVESDGIFKSIFPETELIDSFSIDSHCFGHTMELVPSGQAVRWQNPANGINVYVSPGAKSDTCRTYLGVTVLNGEKRKFRGEMCSPSRGLWRIQQ